MRFVEVAAFNRFEEIEAWQTSRGLTRRIYEVTSSGSFGRDFSLRDQIRRASVSVMSNIAEGFERRSTRDFIRFLRIACASTAEVQTELYVALDVGHIDRAQFNRLHALSRQTGKLLGGLIRYLRTQLETASSRTA